MSEQDLKDFLAAIEVIRNEVTTEEQAQTMLREEGYLNDQNEVAEAYSSEDR